MLRLARPLSICRALSTQAALPKEAPVKMYGIAGRYANAIYAAAAKSDSLPAVEADLNLLMQTMKVSPALKGFCMDPGVARPAKAAGITDVLTAAGACDVTVKSMKVLAEGGRMGEVEKVANLFGQIMMAAKGEMRATITLAKQVSDAEMKEIEASLVDMMDAKQITIEWKVDPSLINGMTVEVGDKYLDMSVSSQLKKLHQLLLGGI